MSLLLPLSLARADCNRNGLPDADDIATGRSEDCNGNSIPDECEGAPLPVVASVESVSGTATRALAIGDIDGDGVSDVVAGLSDSAVIRRVTVFLNRGERRFDAESFELAERPDALCLVDIEADGDLDIAAVSSNALYTLVNRGDGSFEEARRMEIGSTPTAVAAADLDGDEFPDLAVADRGDDVVFVLRNDRRGGFDEPRSVPVGESPRSLVFADLDADGDVDLAVASWQSRDVHVLLNDGIGGLTVSETIAVPSRPYYVSALDFDGDGRVDLAVATAGGIVIFGGGDDGFAETVSITLGAGFVTPGGLALVDIDGDGAPDLAASFLSRGIVTVLARTATLPTAAVVATGQYLSVAAADLDGDGLPDFAATTSRSVDFLWSGEPSSSALGFDQNVFPHPAQPHWSSPDDFDGDGDLDLVVSDGGVSTVTVQLNDGQGGLRQSFLGRSGGYINSVTSADFDRDGRIDAAVTSMRNSVAVVFLAARGPQAAQYPTGTSPFGIENADFNGDDYPDIITANPGNNSVSVLLNRQDGTFAPQRLYPVGPRPQTISPADLDGDRDIDVAIGNVGNSISLLVNDGDGLFEEVRLPLTGIRAVTAADLDGDADVDLAATHSANRVIVLENAGGEFIERPAVTMNRTPAFVTSGDVDLDGLPDLITSNSLRGPVFPPSRQEEPGNGSVSVFLGKGALEYEAPQSIEVGPDPRSLHARDMNGDSVPDVVVINHDNMTISVLTNRLRRAVDEPYRTEICTERDFFDISVPASGGSRRRVLKWVAPARPGGDSLPVLFQNVRLQPLHQEFLAENFPDRFPALDRDTYDALVHRRDTREYYVGNMYQLKSDGRTFYGFGVITGVFDDATEALREDEARAVFAALSPVFRLRDLVFTPETAIEREAAAAWSDPGFEVFLENPDTGVAFRAYTQGVAFGRVRVLDPAEFAEANATGRLGFQDIPVLVETPRDVESVVAALVTATEQTDASHVAVRTARRGTPNAFIVDAVAVFTPLDGRLIRLEVTERDYSWRPATAADADAWWAENRPSLSTAPSIDRDFGELVDLATIELDGDAPLESRIGGKAANFARLQRVFTGDLAAYRAAAFAVPLRYYVDFMESNTIASAVDPDRDVTYSEFVAEVLAEDRFQSDSEHRLRVLQGFRDHIEEHGEVDAGLVRSVALSVARVFGDTNESVRLRSSSNVEDALEFNGAGLYDSTSACAADDLDSNDAGPSRCDATRGDERGVARALKRVWASLWNFRAFEERAYYGIPQELAGMGVLVSQAFPGERANGVVFTANPSNPFDRRYVVSVQKDDASVVSPEPGTRIERDLLEVIDGEVRAIVRAASSSLVADGETVLSDEELRELGGAVWAIDQRFEIDLASHAREDVLLDIEFKITADGDLAFKQARPFLVSAPAPAVRELALEVPEGAAACASFADFRTPRLTWELKSQMRFRPGRILLPTTRSYFPGELFDEVRLGPERRLATPSGRGIFRAARSASDPLDLTFSFEQEYTLDDGAPGGGTPFTLELEGLELRAGPGEPAVATFDGESLQGFLTLQGRLGDNVVTYGSCSFDDLRLWEVAVELEDGGRIRLLERHEPPVAITETGPARLVRAELDLLGLERTVDDYWDLVYTAARHNLEVAYWIVLDAPVSLPGVERPVRAIEVVAPEARFGVAEAVHYLDESLGVISSPAVRWFSRREAGVPVPFRRGDAVANGRIDITDAIGLLEYLFRGGATPRCLDAADANDDGGVNLSDAVSILDHLFLGRGDLPAPFGICGLDPTGDGVECGSYSFCE